MRSLIIFAISTLVVFTVNAQDQTERGQNKEAAQKYFQENINPFITKQHDEFVTKLSREDRALLTELKAEHAKVASAKKDRKERPKNEDIPTDISRDEFHKLMKEKKAGRSEEKESFKMDLKYLSHKYQEELEVHMEAIKAKKEVWQKDMKEMRPKHEDKKEMKEMGKDKKQMKEKAKRKKGQAKRGERGERGFMSKFLLWDTNAASENNMRGFGMGR